MERVIDLAPPAYRQDDPFLPAVFSFVEPICTLLRTRDEEALTKLCTQYPDFRAADAQGKVGHHFIVARSDALAKADTFELVDATAAHYQALGCAFMVVEATNQRTGAECEVLGGVRVHFAPYQAQPPNPSKDSGSMSYVIRLI